MHRPEKYSLLLIAFALVVIISCKKDNKTTPDPVVTAPAISSFSPASITSNQTGFSIRIVGSNFNTDKASTVVKFNGITATVYSVSDTVIFAGFPPINASSGKITVITGGITLTTTTDFVINSAPPQLITGPQYGGLPGAIIGLPGSFFDPVAANNTVTVNGTLAVINLANAGEVYFTVPTNATTGKLILTTRGTALAYPVDFTIPKGSFTTVANAAPADISFDAAGNLYGTTSLNTIIKISPTGVVSTLAVIGSSSTVLSGCVADAAGNVYVSASYDQVVIGATTSKTTTANDLKIYKVSPTGVVTTLAGSGTSGFADGQGTAAQFIAPTALAIDAAGNIYVLDSLRIRKITPNGTVSTLAGSTALNGPPADGQGAAAVFSSTKGIVVDALGNVYVSCVSSFRKITPGGLVATLNTSYSGLPTPQPFNALGDVTVKMAIDANGNILLGAGAILKIDKTGIITDTFFNPNPGGLNGMALDASGNIFVSGAMPDFTNGVMSLVPKIVKVVYK